MTTPAERGEVLRAILAVYEKRAQDMAEAISTEMGAPIDMALTDQAGAGRSHLKAFIRALDAFEWEHPLRPGVEGQEMSYEPAGVAALITPWNWPMNQVVLKVGAALAAGCTMVLKPSEVAPMSSILFSEIIHEAGVPAGVYNMVNGDGAGVGSILSAHPEIDVVSFTGSTRAGILISKAAADTVKTVSLELGANRRTRCFPIPMSTRPWRAGQLLFRQYRPVLQRGDPHACRTRLLRARRRGGEGHRRATVVDLPSKAGGHIGPLVSQVQFDKVQRLIQAGIDEGARLVAGGTGRPEGLNRGWFAKPTVFADATPDMTIMREEIFGPVLAMMPFDSEEEAIELANDTPYGLAAYVQTDDPQSAARLAAASCRHDPGKWRAPRVGGTVRRLQAIRCGARRRRLGYRGIPRDQDRQRHHRRVRGAP